MNIPKIFVAVDLETTGLEFDKDEIIEVALVRFEDGRAVESCDFFVKPALRLRPFISYLTGIAQETLEQAEEFQAIAGKLREFIGEFPLVAHNANFDVHFLKAAFEKVGIEFGNHPVFDSLAISRIAFPGMPNHKLSTLVSELGIERESAHRAVPDASAAGDVFLRSLAEIATWPSNLQAMLSKAAAGTIWGSVLEFAESSEPLSYKLKDLPAVTPLLRQKVRMRTDEFFGEKGRLAKAGSQAPTTELQKNFSRSVERNMYQGSVAIFEAADDFGKSLAYLVPAAIHAAAGERVVISVANKKLQERLYNEELPLLKKIFGDALKPCVLRGRNSYVCLRKLEEGLNDVENYFDDDERETVMTLIPWIARTETGDISENAGFNYIRNRIVWNKLKSDSLTCNAECNAEHFACPASVAKRQAASSNLIFVDHELFVSDMQLDFSLIPAYDHVIFDEAHLLPEISTQLLGRSVRFFDLRNPLKILVHPKDETKGLIAVAEKALPSELVACTEIRTQIKEAEKALHRFFMKLGKRLSKKRPDNFRYKRGIIAEFDVSPTQVSEEVSKLKAELGALIAKLSDGGNKGVAGSLGVVLSALSSFASDFEFLVHAERGEYVFFLEEPFNPHTVRLAATPLDIGKIWREKFYPRAGSVTFTSPAVSIKRSFDYFACKMGLGPDSGLRKPFARTLQATPNEVKLAVANFLPKPNSADFQKAVDAFLASVLPDLEGNTLVLFASAFAMTKAHQAISAAFAAKNKLLLCQSVDGPTDNLLDIFRKERGVCLLANQPFGDGLDFPSEVLKNLIVLKLPFPNYADSLVSATAEALKENGQNAFKEFLVPEAFLTLAREFSSLVGTAKGAKITLLDSRILTEVYGKTFAQLWNSKHTVLASEAAARSFLAE